MAKRVRIATTVLLIVIVIALGWQFLWPREPMYQGKRLSVWIKEGYMGKGSGLKPQKANEAVLAVGTNALPFYLEMLEGSADSPLKTQICDLLTKQPKLKLRFIESWRCSQLTRRAIGWIGLGILGTNAQPAIPALTKLLNEGDTDQVGRAARIMSDMGLEGIQPLTNLLRKAKSKNSSDAIFALGLYAKPQSEWSKSRAPEEVQCAAKLIVPVLLAHLKDSGINSDVQVNAIQSLGWFACEPGTVVPAISVLLQDSRSDQRTRYTSILALEDYGDRAKGAVLALLKSLQDRDPDVCREAALALKRIDPNAAAEAGVNEVQ